MPIQRIFGENLRRLALERGPLARAARDLDLSKVQMQRYMNGESFPKPAELQRICGYFGVDARIMTTPLDDLRRGQDGPLAAHPDPVAAALVEAGAFLRPSPLHFTADPQFPDGHYIYFRKSMSRPNRIARSCVKIATLAHCRVLRGFDSARLTPAERNRTPHAQREYRGLVLRQPVGTTIFMFHAAPDRPISSLYLGPPVPTMSVNRYHGVVTFGRLQLQGTNYTTRALWMPVENRMTAIMAAHRAAGLLPRDEVPEDILHHLDQPL